MLINGWKEAPASEGRREDRAIEVYVSGVPATR